MTMELQLGLFRAIFENSPHVMLVIDQNCSVRNINRAGNTFIGKDRGETLGLLAGRALQCVNSLEHPGCGKQAPCSNCPIRTRVMHTFATGESIFEERGRLTIHSDSLDIPMDFLISTQCIKMETESFVLLTLVDITEQKRMNKEREQFDAQMRQTLETGATTALEDAKRLWDLAGDTLTGGIIHDLSNIVSAIVGYAELVRADLPETAQLAGQYVSEILTGGERARVLVRLMLAFSRVLPEERHPLKLGPLVKDSIKFMRRVIPETVAVRLDVSDMTDTVVADAAKIHLIVFHLCMNAWQIMRDDHGTLYVWLDFIEIAGNTANVCLDLKPGFYARLSIGALRHDTACVHHVPPLKINGEKRNKAEKNCLRLTYVEDVVRSQGGVLAVDGDPDTGMTFDMFLPAVRESSSVLESVAQEELPRGNERILLVDDEESILGIISPMLLSLGYHVTTRRDGASALNTFIANPERFDLLFTDLTMPNMNGLELTAKVREIRPELRVILCSGYGDFLTPEKAVENGLQAVLMKPMTVLETALTVRQVLDGLDFRKE